jgi:uncharacterized protein (DUF58 family)
MRPGPLLPRCLGALCLLALLLPLVPALAQLLLTVLLLLFAAAAAELSLLWRVRLSAERPEVVALSLGELETTPLKLRGDAERPLEISLRQVWPALIETPSVTREGLLRPGEVLALELPLRGIARGRARIQPPHVALRLWGFCERLLRLDDAGAEIVVMPDLRAVAGVHAKLNRFALQGLGSRTSARLGKGREFDRLREYVRGDEVRDVAWKATARRGKLIVREYRLDRSQDVLLCLDAGHRMAARLGGLSKLDHAVNAAVLLAYICNRMEDKLAMLSFATEVNYGVPHGRGAAHLRRLTEFAASVHDAYVHSDYLALGADLRRRLRHRTLIVLMTALPDADHEALLRGLRMLAPQHLPLVLVLQDPDLRAAAQFLPADKRELARTLAARDLLAGREQAIREARALGARVVEVDPGAAGVAVMNAYIDIKRRQLL